MPSEDTIRRLLAGYLEISGVVAALLVSGDGLVISSAGEEEVDTEVISALVADTVTAGQRFGQEAEVGPVDTMVIEYKKMTLLLAPFEEGMILVIAASPGTVELNTQILSPQRTGDLGGSDT